MESNVNQYSFFKGKEQGQITLPFLIFRFTLASLKSKSDGSLEELSELALRKSAKYLIRSTDPSFFI